MTQEGLARSVLRVFFCGQKHTKPVRLTGKKVRQGTPPRISQNQLP